MDVTLLKSGFWGYKKSSVCEYIAEMDREFSQRLMNATKENDRLLQELQGKISQFEEENGILRRERDRVTRDNEHLLQELQGKVSQLEEENSTLRKERDSVTRVMVDAKAYSDELRTRSEAEDKKFREKNMRYNQKQFQRIDKFGKEIDDILCDIRRFIDSIDKDISENKLKMNELKDTFESDGCIQKEDDFLSENALK